MGSWNNVYNSGTDPFMENLGILKIMSKSEKCIISFTTCVMLTLCLSLNLQAKEPMYNGKPLSEWICCALPDDQEEAFMHIGTNCLPIVLDIIGATDKGMKRVARRLESQGFRAQAQSGDDGVINQLRESASKAFDILGTNAVSAVPRLVKILNENDETTSIYAADALGQVGPEGFIALTNLLTSKGTNSRIAVVMAIAQGGFDPRTATPILASLLKDELPDVRRFAAGGLGKGDPDVIVPLLVPVLNDPNAEVRSAAASALGSYGAKAKDALPEIVSAYTNSITAGLSLQTYRAFSDALKSIDPEQAKKAEAFVIRNPINPYRFYYTRTKLKNGLELIAGGYIRSEILFPTNHYLSSAELYDPKSGKWTETGEMTTPRYDHAAALLPSGKVLVAGGGGEKGLVLSAELYDPTTEKWTKTGPLKKPMAGGQIFVQPDGAATYHTGFHPPFEKELYDPAGGTWEEITNK